MRNNTTFVLREDTLTDLLVYLKKRAYSDPQEAIALIEEAMPIAIANADEDSHFSLVNHLGVIYLKQGLFAKALPCFEAALSISLAMKHLDYQAVIYNNLGLVYKAQSLFAQALDYFFQGLTLNEAKWNAYLYNNVGSVLEKQDENEKALSYYQKALTAMQAIEDTPMSLTLYINIGAIYYKLEQLDAAILYYKEGLAMALQDGAYILHQAMFYQNLGAVYAAQEKRKKGLKKYQKALNIYKQNEFNFYWMRCLLEMGVLYLKIDIAKSEKCFQEAYQLCKKFAYAADEIECLERLHAYYESSNQSTPLLEILKHLVQAQRTYFSHKIDEKIATIVDAKESQIQVLIEKNEHISLQNKALSTSNKALEEYAYVIAHDLKEPLRNINSFAALLRRKHHDNLNEDCQNYLTIIDENTKQINQKLEDLLHYANLSIRENDEKTWIALKPFVMQQLSYFDINATVEIADTVKIKAIPKHIHLLFQQMIENALKFQSKDRNLRLKITCENQRKGKYLIGIHDNGIGIDTAYFQQIFKVFKRLDKQNYKGTGIGLAICKKIAALYDASIRVASTVGEGSSFYIEWRM